MTAEHLSPTQLAWRKLRQNRTAVFGAVVLSILYAGAFLGSFVAPYGYNSLAQTRSFHPPSTIHLRDEQGNWRWPFVYNTVDLKDETLGHHYVEVTEANLPGILAHPSAKRFEGELVPRRYPLRLFAHGEEVPFWGLPGLDSRIRRRLVGLDLSGVPEADLAAMKNPPRFYLFGADALGRDLFSRIVYGSRVSLTVGLIGVVISFMLGMLVGGFSGFAGGRTDIALQRLCECMMMLPGFYLMLSLRAAFPAQLGSTATYLMVIGIMAFIGWAGLARTIRGMTLSISRSDYVTAARALGVPGLSILRRHILPQTVSYATVAVTLAIPGYMLGESGLSFLGLGIQEPEASWGNLLTAARDTADLALHPWVLAPGFFIFVTVVAFNFLGDGLRDAFDPKTLLRGPGPS